ncbi:MAG: MFS transporter [Phycisphaerales bacterium]|nr:MFS transporter [Phycisphaerales bacterium]
MSLQSAESRLPAWLVQNRNFVLLWCAYGTAAMADHLGETALLNTRNALEREDSTRVQALISFGFFLPFVLLGPLAGWWSDRFSRKWTMVLADVARAVLVFNLGALVAFLVAVLPAAWADFSIVIPLAAVGLLAAFFSPARQALLPSLIREDQLVRANALINALGTIGAILGIVAGGWIVTRYGATITFHVNALAFCFSAACVLLIDTRRLRAAPHTPISGVWAPLADGLRYVQTHRRVVQLIGLMTLFWGVAGVVIAVVPALAKQLFPGNYEMLAYFRGLLGIGLALGATVMTIFGSAVPVQLSLLLALGAAGLWLALLATCSALGLGAIVTGLALLGIGGAGAAIQVSVLATLQRFVPDARRGRVFGVSDTCTMGAMVLTSAALGLPHLPQLDRYVPLLLAGCAAAFLLAALTAGRGYLRHRDVGPGVALIWLFVRFFAAWRLRLRLVGRCTVPREGAVILAANHTAGVDPMAILACCRHRMVSFIVAQEHYNMPILKTFMQWGRCLPVNRENPGKAFLASAMKLLKSGGCLGIFPQGTFEIPGEETPAAKSGVGLLALRTGATVIPCHISGTRYFNSPMRSYLTRHRMRIRFGPPVDLSALAGRERDKAATDEASDRIWEAIEALAPNPEETAGRG